MADLTFGHMTMKTKMQDKSLTWGLYAETPAGEKLMLSSIVGKSTATELRMIAQAIQDEFEVIEEVA
jgi:hypothetical protein